MTISFTNLTKKPIRTAVFVRLAKKIFPKKDFDLSVVFASPAFMKKLNIQYRNKHKSANVLSFSYDKNSGEIFLNSAEKDLPYLFVHGCLHLLDYDHKKNKDALRMESLERKILNKQN